ncbi:MAG: phytanoyl-CoA dioxygenase family protein [Capsulimonadaceae bacterium]|nr:phytanoyl-CoA dioxygenase family protein [Capsulimonadaceae bacterium]
MNVQMGTRELEVGGRYLGFLRDSNDLLGDFDALRARYAEDGYVLVRGLHKPAKVRAARKALIESLDAAGQLDRNFPLDDAMIAEGARGAFQGGARAASRLPEYLAVVEADELLAFFAGFLQGPSITFDFKWLRAVPTGGFTGSHYDVVYMGRGTLNLFTLWTPLGRVTYDMGTLAILQGSHKADEFARLRETYGKMDVDRDNVEGWFSSDPIEIVDKFGGRWLTTEFEPGDAIFFGMYTMHGSLNNITNRFRLSCDTRYQRADEPADERWVGAEPKGHTDWNKTPALPMAEAREKWGV